MFGDAARWAWERPPAGEDRSLGFSLLAAGALSGTIGVAAVLFAQEAGGMQRYVYREIAGAALGFALAAFLAGAVSVLPLRRYVRVAGALGFALCAAGVGVFVWLYPTHWNVLGRDWSPYGVVTYSVGLLGLVAASANGLLVAYLEMRERRAQSTGPAEDDVTDEEVVRDLLETTARSRLSWGGVRSDDRELQLAPNWATNGQVRGNFHRLAISVSIPDDGLKDDVGTLLTFRGGRDSASEDYDDSPVAALARLRSEQAAAAAQASWWQRLTAWWRGAA